MSRCLVLRRWTTRPCSTVAAGQDLDDDGFDDLLLGSEGLVGPEGAGAVYFVPGPVEGAFDVSDVAIEIYGDSTGDGATRPAILGDLDADGLPDFAVGAPWVDDGATDAGAVYLSFGWGR